MRISDIFTDAQNQVLADLHARDIQERQAGIRQPLSLKAVAPAVAQLLYLLIIEKWAKTVVEFGTSHGYSTIHLAAAVDRTDGHVYTVDRIPEKTALAESNLRKAGLLHRVSAVTSDGVKFAGSLPGSIDFVFVDYGAAAFVPAFNVLRNQMAIGCVVFVDGGADGYWNGDAKELRELLDHDPDLLVSILPMHKDQLIAIRIGPDTKHKETRAELCHAR